MTRLSTNVSSKQATVLTAGADVVVVDVVDVDVGTDSGDWDAWTQQLGASASGGAPPYTYEWTVLSGGAGTFDDATAADAVFSCTSPGAAGTTSLRCTVTDSAMQTAHADLVLNTSIAAVVTNGTNVTRRWWFECSDATVTRDGSNLVEQVSDRWAGALHLTQSTSGNKPLYQATGGPDSLPCVSLADTDNYVFNTAVSIAADTRPFRIAVLRVGTGNMRALSARDQNGVATGETVQAIGRSASSEFLIITKQSGGSQTTTVASSPAVDDDWHVQSHDYDAGGFAWKIDNALVDPQPSGSGAAVAIETITWGHATAAGGAVAADICVDSPPAAGKAYLYNYLALKYGL